MDKLTRVGFNLEYGEENSGWQFKYLTRGGGYYFNVGASDLIADGKIKVLQFSNIENFILWIEMKSGEKLDIDLMVTATGYKGQEYVVENYLANQLLTKLVLFGDLMMKGKIKKYVDANQTARTLVSCRKFSSM